MININQESVKELLLKLETCDTDFKVIFSGKKSNKVNGLYKQDINEIVIHNKNFKNDNELIYTAIHEYSHHLMWCKYHKIGKVPKHNNEFWSIMYNLIDLAEEKNLYKKYPKEAIECKVPEIDIERLEDVFNEIKSSESENNKVIKENQSKEFNSLKPISKQAKKLLEKIISNKKSYPIYVKMNKRENTMTIRYDSSTPASFPEFVLLVKEFSYGKEYYPIQEIYFDYKGTIKKFSLLSDGYSFITNSKAQKQSTVHCRLMIEHINRKKISLK